MFLKIILCTLLVMRGAAADELLTALGGARGGNKVTLCMGSAQCAGVLWGRRWVLARASCLLHRSPRPVLVLHHASEPGLTCEHSPIDGRMGRVRRWYMHPQYRGGPPQPAPRPWDLALVMLDREIVHTFDIIVNVTCAEDLFKTFGSWMKSVYMKHYTKPEHKQDEGMDMQEARVFLTLVILPLLIFMAVFLFIIFGTGTPVKVPYRNIDYDPVYEPFYEPVPIHIGS